MNKGFTLVELIAVIVILALLVIITTPAYNSISNSIRTRNYESKKSTIKSETLKYVEKYLKSDIYSGVDDKVKENRNRGIKCFTVNYLIRNGIISSDDDIEEYIINDKTNDEYKGDTVYLIVMYDYKNLKLVALTDGEEKEIDGTLITFNHDLCVNKPSVSGGLAVYYNTEEDYDNTY